MIRLKSNKLKLGLLNARSLNTGRDELLAAVSKHRPDILALNETWIREGNENSAPLLPGYTLKLRPRPNDARGGGLGFYIRNGLRVRSRPHPVAAVGDAYAGLEQFWLELTLAGAGRIAIATAYRPERVTVGSAIEALSESVSAFNHCDHIFVLTDFNVDLLQPSTSAARELLSFLYQRNLEQLVTEPTRVTNSSATLLDLFITSSPNLCCNVSVLHNACLSDHAMIVAECNIKRPKEVPHYIYTRNLNSIDDTEFESDLHELTWSEVEKCCGVNNKIELFNVLLLSLYDKHAPSRKLRVNNRPTPWITDNIKLMMSLRDEALVRANKSKIESHRGYYKQLRNLVNGALDREKGAYLNFYVNSNKNAPKKMWSHFRNVLSSGISTSMPPHLSNPDEINDFFLDIPGVDEVETDHVNLTTTTCIKNSFKLEKCSDFQVMKIIDSIKTKAHGHDGITVDMIRRTLKVTLPVITNIINTSIETNVFPDTWKIARVKPIPKSSKVEEIKDLRPISIVPILSKVLERIVCSQLTTYLENENILPVVQSGFRKRHGTDTALAHVIDDIITATDTGKVSALVLLDFSRAFDCISTELLIAKMSCYGVSRGVCDWFRSFLTNRRQYVEIQNLSGDIIKSGAKTVGRGTPQGSILSPILFILYTSDLVHNLKYCNVHLYADDTQIYHSFLPTDTMKAINDLNQDLAIVSEWASRNALVLNPNKSKYIILGSKYQRSRVLDQNPLVFIENANISRVETAKNLGLLIDSDLNFEEHINLKIRNAFFRLRLLYKIRKFLTVEIRQILVESLVLSVFNYCDTVYGPRILKYTQNAIQRVQNACARFCYNIPKRAHVTPFLNANDVLKMNYRRDLHFACLIHKIVYTQTPKYLYNKLSWFRDAHSKNTRSKNTKLLSIPRYTTAGFRGGFKHAAAKIWNDLPPPLHESMSQLNFKSKLRKIFLIIQKDA